MEFVAADIEEQQLAKSAATDGARCRRGPHVESSDISWGSGQSRFASGWRRSHRASRLPAWLWGLRRRASRVPGRTCLLAADASAYLCSADSCARWIFNASTAVRVWRSSAVSATRATIALVTTGPFGSCLSSVQLWLAQYALGITPTRGIPTFVGHRTDHDPCRRLRARGSDSLARNLFGCSIRTSCTACRWLRCRSSSFSRPWQDRRAGPWSGPSRIVRWPRRPRLRRTTGCSRGPRAEFQRSR